MALSIYWVCTDCAATVSTWRRTENVAPSQTLGPGEHAGQDSNPGTCARCGRPEVTHLWLGLESQNPDLARRLKEVLEP